MKQKPITYSAVGSVDLFDVISKKYLAKGLQGNIMIKIPANEAILLVEMPAGMKIKKEGKKLIANERVITYY